MGKIVVRKINLVKCNPIDKNRQRCEVQVVDGNNHPVGGGFLTLANSVAQGKNKRCPPKDPFCDAELPQIRM